MCMSCAAIWRNNKQINTYDVATECVLYFGCAVQETLCRRKSKFLMKMKYKTTSNLLYHAVQKVASDELAELQKVCFLYACLMYAISWFFFFSTVKLYSSLFLIVYHVFGE